MNKLITTLFKDRSQLIFRQVSLAREINHNLTLKPQKSQELDYNSLIKLQKEIADKEKTIVEYCKNLNTAN